MKWRPTLWLVGLCATLFAFLFLYERTPRTVTLPGAAVPLLPDFKAAEVTGILLKRTNQIVLKAVGTNDTWNLVTPFAYPAQPYAIQGLLQSLENLAGQTHITFEEMTARKQSAAEFGFDVPLAAVTVEQGARRSEIQFGRKTPVGDQVYVQVAGKTGISLVTAEVLDRLPRTANDWRDPALLTTRGLTIDRIEVRSPGRGFAVQVDPASRAWQLTRPLQVRANGPRVTDLLRQILATQVSQFVTGGAVTDLEPYGLLQPELELALARGTNELVAIQLGKSPADDPSTVYARRSQHNNIVLVSRQLLDTLRVPFTELRDPLLLTFKPETVETIDVIGEDSFTVQRLGADAWSIGGSATNLADATMVRDWLAQLSRVEIQDFVKDVVTDFSAYGLAPARRQILLKGPPATAGSTNRILGQIELGHVQDDLVLARRSDENSVYAIKRGDVARFPSAAWQLRDRRIWSFPPDKLARVTIRQRGRTREIVRNAAGNWTLAAGSEGIINPASTEETLIHLADVRAAVWVARGEEQRARFGFTDTGHKLTLELKNGDKPVTYSVEFGGKAASGFPWALTQLDGQTYIFEFPFALFFEVMRDLRIPEPRVLDANP